MNHFSKERRVKRNLLARIAVLDSIVNSSGLDDAGWEQRYSLEQSLMDLHRLEEEFWRQRGRISWTVKGDLMTMYFFAIANGRRRRCLIARLYINGIIVEDPLVIEAHIMEFYSSLLSAKPSN